MEEGLQRRPDDWVGGLGEATPSPVEEQGFSPVTIAGIPPVWDPGGT